MNRKVSIDELAAAIQDTLLAYTEEVAQAVKEEAKADAEELKNAIAKDAKNKFGGSGRYAKGWKSVKAYESDLDIRYVVKNKTDWQLTHLLEYGHAKWLWGKNTGGRVEGRAHIRPNADRIVKKFEAAVERIVKGRG